MTDQIISTLISSFISVAATWYVAWKYYKKAGDELKREATLLRQASAVIIHALQNRDAKIEVQLDGEGNPVALTVGGIGEGRGTSTVKGGVGAGTKRDF